MEKKEMKKTYYFCDADFLALIRQGVICSLKKTGDFLDTQYADEESGFGAVYLVYREKDGALKEFCPNTSSGYMEEAPHRVHGFLSYQGTGKNETLEVQTGYRLADGRLEQHICVKNVSSDAVTVTDVGIYHACHTDFDWGKPAGPSVIGHHYAGGHSAHAAYYRVDGAGAALFFSPMNGTLLSYLDARPHYEPENPKEVPEKGCTMLYPFAAARGERAAKKGAKLHIPQETHTLIPGECLSFDFCYFWAPHFLQAADAMTAQGLVYPVSVPGYTLPIGTEAQLFLKSDWEDLTVSLGDGAGEVRFDHKTADGVFYRLRFEQLGEQTVTVSYGNGRFMQLYYFVTEAVETLWKKRAAFIASHQITDDTLWYNGLLCEHNNETGTLLTPDNYDKIGGWRIYEVTCDDPGLSKPAFLSSKQTVFPDQEEISALDYYISHFVWGGLQQTTAEPYPYGIYGIPDWKKLRDSKDEGTRGKLHIWRIYDYPHIALTYYNMYCVARDYPEMKMQLTAEEYLTRAYGTACAMFTIPSEIEDWSAYKTGLYNERVIPHIVDALRECGRSFEADRLHTFWMRKVKFFATECKDVFGSEYPFDTTGFESTYYLAEDAMKAAVMEQDLSPFAEGIPYGKAQAFLESQHSCNLACRGYLEPAYYCYGSDYRGNNTHYLLSYMSQMGGCSVLEHALYYEKEPWEMLRLGYGSLLSSYALMNTGTEESNYGYWFPGKEHDGAAGGGFEPLCEGETWLNQPHHGGSWYYSCEIDLGFCGGLRGAALIAAKDPLFGWLAYGGTMEEKADSYLIKNADQGGRRFHYLEGKKRFHALLDRGAFAQETAVIQKDTSKIELHFEPYPKERTLHISFLEMGAPEGVDGTDCEIRLEPNQTVLVLKFEA